MKPPTVKAGSSAIPKRATTSARSPKPRQPEQASVASQRAAAQAWELALQRAQQWDSAAVLLTRGPDAEMPRGSTVEAVIDRSIYLEADKVQFTGPGPSLLASRPAQSRASPQPRPILNSRLAQTIDTAVIPSAARDLLLRREIGMLRSVYVFSNRTIRKGGASAPPSSSAKPRGFSP